MHDFYFYSPTKIFFGRNAEDNLGTALKAEGATKLLIHYGQGSVIKSGLLAKAKKLLDEVQIPYIELGGAQANPRDTLAEEGAAICRRENIDYILALGGGSCLDSAKTMAILAKSEHSCYDLFVERVPVKEAIPVATVMTFPATGSEASNSAVINLTKEGLKRGVGSDLIRPKLAFLNPELSYTLPHNQTFYGVADIMAHIMERYFNDTCDNNITNSWSESLMRELIYNARIVYKNPTDYNARAAIMWASTLAHNNLLSCGVELGDWSSHALEHELSYQYDVAHGAGLAVVFPNWMRYVLPHNPHKLARFAREVFNISGDYNNLEAWGAAGIRALQDFYRSVDLPLTFAELGAKREDIPEMAARVKRGPDGFTGGYLKLDEAACRAIFELCCEELA